MVLEPYLIVLVLLAAVSHASWNAVVKKSTGGLFTVATVMGSGGVVCLFFIPFVSFPVNGAPYLVGSMTLHLGYYVFLWYALRKGDLSFAYPIARGSAPLLVAGAGAFFAGQYLSIETITSLVIASFGICLFAFDKGLPRGDQLKPFLLAFSTGLFIASYTVVDGVGVREDSDPYGYIVWLNILDGIPMLLYAIVKGGSSYVIYLRQNGPKVFMGGMLAMFGYSVVIYAMSIGNMAHVSALRETSVLFAVILGAFTLGEKFGPIRWIAAICVVVGVASMHITG